MIDAYIFTYLSNSTISINFAIDTGKFELI